MKCKKTGLACIINTGNKNYMLTIFSNLYSMEGLSAIGTMILWKGCPL